MTNAEVSAIHITLGLLLLLSTPLATSGEAEVIVLGQKVQAKEGVAFAPANQSIPILVKYANATPGSVVFDSKLLGAMGGTQVSAKPDLWMFIVQYPFAEHCDTVSLSVLDGKGVKTALAEFHLYPVTVKLRGEFGYSAVRGVVQEDGEFIDPFSYEVYPWHPELKGKLRFIVAEPNLGNPKVSLPDSSANSQKGSVDITLDAQSGTGVTAIGAFLDFGGGNLFECGWRLKVQVGNKASPLSERHRDSQTRDWTAAVDEAWPMLKVIEIPALVKGRERLIRLLNKYPDIPQLKEMLQRCDVVGDTSLLYDLGTKQEYQGDDVDSIRLIARKAIDYGPFPFPDSEPTQGLTPKAKNEMDQEQPRKDEEAKTK